MKRLFIVILCFMLAIRLAACGSSQSNNNSIAPPISVEPKSPEITDQSNDNQEAHSIVEVPESTPDSTQVIDSTENDNEQSITEQAYLEATTLSASDLTKTQRGTYNYRYWNFGEDEISKIGGKTVVNQGAIYNAISWDIANYKDFGAGSSSLFQVVFDSEEKPENANQLIEEISAFVFPNATEKEILAALECCSCVNGEFDYSARHYDFTISDLAECANELHISEEMLGYIFAKLDEYQSELFFNGNSLNCTVNVKTYQSVF